MQTKIALAVALTCASSISFAQMNKTADVGPYAGISGGRATTSFTAQDFNLNLPATVSESADSHNTGWRVFLGYKFDQNWAIEGAYTSLGEAKYKYVGLGALAGQSGEARIDQNSWSAAVKGTLPVSKEFDLFALLGGTSNYSKLNGTISAGVAAAAGIPTSFSESKSRGYGMFGVGVEYKPTANIGIRGEYHNYGKFGSTDTTGRTEADVWLVGVSIKF